MIDKKGIIRYIDVHDIDDQPDNEQLFQVLGEIEPQTKAAGTAGVGSEEPSPTQSFPEVELYCTAWCPSCRRARIYLKSHRIEFTEIDINSDRDAAARVRQWADGNETSPTFNIGGTVIVNFDRDRLDEIFGFVD